MLPTAEHSFKLVLIFHTCLRLRWCSKLLVLPPAAPTLACNIYRDLLFDQRWCFFKQKTSEEQARLVFFFFCVTFSSFTAHPSSSSVFSSRRGSNVSLVLDMSALGSVEPMNAAVVTPREAAAREYLLSANRPLTRQQLQDLVNNTHKLQAEFAVSLV